MHSSVLLEDPSFELLIYAKTPEGAQFAKVVYDHSEKITAAYLSTKYGYFRDKRTAVISIPRGGIPTARATFNCLAEIGTKVSSRYE